MLSDQGVLPLASENLCLAKTSESSTANQWKQILQDDEAVIVAEVAFNSCSGLRGHPKLPILWCFLDQESATVLNHDVRLQQLFDLPEVELSSCHPTVLVTSIRCTMDHVIDLTDDTLQADDTIQSVWATLPENPATIQTRPVEVVISCLAISKAEEWWSAGLLRSRLFRAFTCVNTTHWGIKIGESYYDLKRGRGFFGRPHFQPVRSLEERDERQIVQWIPIGATHFSDEDLDKVGM